MRYTNNDSLEVVKDIFFCDEDGQQVDISLKKDKNFFCKVMHIKEKGFVFLLILFNLVFENSSVFL